MIVVLPAVSGLPAEICVAKYEFKFPVSLAAHFFADLPKQ
jgi:hypothetical protein